METHEDHWRRADPFLVELLKAAEAKIQRILIKLDEDLGNLLEKIDYVKVDTRRCADMAVEIKTRSLPL